MKEFFKANEGTADRVLRTLAGVVLLSLTVVGPRTAWGLVGLVPILTGLAGTCPLYTLLGLSTCAKTPAEPASR